jgi:predicted DNA-binding transcriptional regulator AlpA
MMNDQIPRLLNTQEASDLLRVSISFLMKARLKGDGPRYRKVGRCVRYVESDLLAYLKQNSRMSTSEF